MRVDMTFTRPGAEPLPPAPGPYLRRRAPTSGAWPLAHKRRRFAPAPAWHRCARSDVGARLRVVQREARAPLGVAHDRRAKLGVGRELGAVGGLAQERHET